MTNARHVDRRPVAVTGATGFVGRSVVRALLDAGHPVRALVRDPAKADRTLPTHDELEITPGDLFGAGVLDELCAGSSAVIDLVGIRREYRPEVTYQRLHVESTGAVIGAMERTGVDRLLKMSALGTRAEARSEYHKTKFEAERLVRQSGLRWTIVRPSLILGEGGEFLNMARGWARGDEPPKHFMPYFESPRPFMKESPRPGISATPTIQPVAVEDVAAVFVAAIGSDDAVGEVYPIGGPDRFTWPELLEAVRDGIGATKPVWGIPAEVGEAVARAAVVARLEARLPFCLSDVQMAVEDNVCSTAKLEADLGVSPRAVSFAR